MVSHWLQAYVLIYILQGILFQRDFYNDWLFTGLELFHYILISLNDVCDSCRLPVAINKFFITT